MRKSERTPKPVYKQDPEMEIEEEIKVTKKRKFTTKKKVVVDQSKDEKKMKIVEEEDEDVQLPTCKFIGESIPMDDAKKQWPKRYSPELIQKKQIQENSKRSKKNSNDDDDEEEVLVVKCHYSKAVVNDKQYDLYDNAHVKGDLPDPLICKIIEFFETVDNKAYFTAEWYYRPSDTVIREPEIKAKDDDNEEPEKENKALKDNDDKDKLKNDYAVDIHEKRIFKSCMKNDNLLHCLIEKITIARIASNVDLQTKEAAIAKSLYYYDLCYELPYKSFVSIPPESSGASSESTIAYSEGGLCESSNASSTETGESSKSEWSLLDLYCGCGSMSTGLTLGANIGGVNLVTRWAVDVNIYACQTMERNHPETKVRNESAKNFLSLLKEWQKLCHQYLSRDYPIHDVQASQELKQNIHKNIRKKYVLECFVGISFGDPKINAKNIKKKDKSKRIEATELYFKVHWKGLDSSKDTWVPYSSLRNCHAQIYDFVKMGNQSKILPLPGDVEVICGGPPCQGVSGYNRNRNADEPLKDDKNFQMVIYMDIVKFLNPKYILMENVVDLVKFAKGIVGRYAVRRLLSMDYQIRLGIMAAGSFGLPQYRLRVFVWGAQMGEKIPPYPYPTHDANGHNGVPEEFKQCLVAYEENNKPKLLDDLFLQDAIFDLPQVENEEERDERPYGPVPAKTDFQKYIRLNREGQGQNTRLFDHRPLKLNATDYERVCQIPQKKGANFSNLDGVTTENGKWVIDPTKSRKLLLNSEKPLVPNYALTFVKGKSTKPFSRIWWDETVSTVTTRAEPHNHSMLHPEQNRVLTVRENARLQGIFDFYQLCGPVKQKYVQVGNAVAVPVAKALGYTFALAVMGHCNDEPLIKLPDDFTFIIGRLPSPSLNIEEQ